MNFLTNLNLSQNQIQNALMHPLGTPPAGVESQVYYNLTDHLLYVHNGTTWVAVGAPYTLPTASATVLGGIKVGTGLSINGAGVLSTAGQANVLESVKVNGSALAITTKAVDILITTGSTNGTIKVNSVDIPVYGLASGAYAAEYVSPLTLTPLTTGFSIAGGTTSKTLTVSNTITLAGTDSSTLNIGTGGTLASGAFAAAYVHPNHTGDVTSTGDGATIIGANKVTNAMLATVATKTFKGRKTASTGNVEDLTVADVKTLLGLALTQTALTTGFSIAGGTTSKTLTVSNTMTLAGTDGSTLNIGTGGTLASGAFAAAYSHPTGDGNLHVPANSTTNSGKVLTAGGTAGVYTWESLPADSDTATAVDNILEGSNTGTAITYAPYTTKGAGHFDSGAVAPTDTNRLNYGGYFWATKVYSAGTEVLTAHPTITVIPDTTSTASPAHGATFTVIDTVTRDSNGHVTTLNTKTITLPADTNTATMNDGVFDGSNVGTALTYAPYTNKTAAAGGASSDGKFYLSTSDPDGTTRLNYDGYFYATKLFSGGTEVSVNGHTHTGTYEPVVAVGSANQIWGMNNAGNAKEWKSFSTPGTTGTAPNWVLSTAKQINLHIPMASTSSVTAGLLSNTDYGKIHSQNTDTGTTSSSFAIGTSGVKIKNSGGTELQIRNNGDTAYADLRVNNLVVEGTTTTINSNTVDIGDSNITLNSDITTSATNSNGGISVKRLMANNTTRKDAVLEYNISTDKWQTTTGAVATTLVTLPLTNKYTTTLGDAAATSFVVTHNLNSRDVVITVRETGDDYEVVYTDVRITTANTLTVYFATAPSAAQYTITVVG